VTNVIAPSQPEPPHSVTHTTFSLTPLDERSARRRGLHLTTHNTHMR